MPLVDYQIKITPIHKLFEYSGGSDRGHLKK